jgi:hypothetical protein
MLTILKLLGALIVIGAFLWLLDKIFSSAAEEDVHSEEFFRMFDD